LYASSKVKITALLLLLAVLMMLLLETEGINWLYATFGNAITVAGPIRIVIKIIAI
jgi:hypothetical protein